MRMIIVGIRSIGFSTLRSMLGRYVVIIKLMIPKTLILSILLSGVGIFVAHSIVFAQMADGYVYRQYSASDYIVGTKMLFDVPWVISRDSLQSVWIVQHVTASDQTDGMIIVSYNFGQTTEAKPTAAGDCYSPTDEYKTVYGTSMFVNVAGVLYSDPPIGVPVTPQDPGTNSCLYSWRDNPGIDDQLSVLSAMSRTDSCQIYCDPGTDTVKWRLETDNLNAAGCSTGKWVTFNNVYPTHVTKAEHGVHSWNANEENDLHVRSLEHREFKALIDQCLIPLQCPGGDTWSITEGAQWGSLLSILENAPPTIQVYSEDQSWHICLGKVPETPCGCLTCPYPAAFAPGAPSSTQKNVKWLPERLTPLRVSADSSSLPNNTIINWNRVVRDAMRKWNLTLDKCVFKQGTSSNHDIEVIGSYMAPNTFGSVGDLLDSLPEVSFDSWGCPHPPINYLQLAGSSGEVWMNTNSAVEFTEDPIVTTSDYNKGVSEMWAVYTVVHELGHLLGVAHYPLSPGCPSLAPPTITSTPTVNIPTATMQTPGTPTATGTVSTPTPTSTPTRTPTSPPTPTPLPFAVMCAPISPENFYRVPIEIQMSSTVNDSIECILHSK